MSQVLLFNKPFNVLSQFTDKERTDNPRKTLADFLEAPQYRAAGRLDYDSEGLLILTNDGALQHQLANPRGKQWKTYWVQVEGEATLLYASDYLMGWILRTADRFQPVVNFWKYRLFGIGIHQSGTERRYPIAGLSSQFERVETVKCVV